MNTEHELFGELHEQEENGLFENEHKRQYEAQQEALHLSTVSESEIFEHYGKPFTSGKDLWDFLTTHYNFIPKT